MLEIVKVGKTHKGTWIDRAGETYSYHLDTNSTGLRVNVHRWFDTCEVEVKFIKGDGRSADFKEYGKVTLQNPTQEQINEAVKHLLETCPV